MPTFSVLRHLSRYLLNYKKQLIAASIALIFTSVVTLSMGYGVRLLIDDGFSSGSSEQLIYATKIIIVIALMMSVGTFARFYLVSWIGERVCADIRKSVFTHLLTLHPNYFEENRSGEIMSRLTTDTTLLQTVIGSSSSMALRSLLNLTGGIVMMLITHLKLSLLVLVSVPLVLIPIVFFGQRVRKLSRKSQDSIADVGSHAGEIIQQIKTVQSYTQEENEQKRFSAHVENAFTIAKGRVKQRAFLIAIVIFLLFSAISIMLWVGGQDVLSGAMTAGELGAFVFFAVIVATAFATLSEVIGDVQRAVGAAERLFELLNVRSNIQIERITETASQTASVLDFNNVTFSYPSRPQTPALKNFSLSIKKGQSLALVGPSGAGKSSVFELLQRFYDPQQGHITLSGENIKTLPPKTLRESMAIVAQQPSLFSHDIMYNVAYGKPNASKQDVIAAAKAAYADEFIEQLPDQYASFLGEQGVRLSGGQRQRIAIARAILKDPAILLLDEATSALDSHSEHKVQQALENLMKNRTTIIIAHRLATIRNVDQIAVLDKGELVDLGSHEELIARCELYQQLSKLQFQ